MRICFRTNSSDDRDRPIDLISVLNLIRPASAEKKEEAKSYQIWNESLAEKSTQKRLKCVLIFAVYKLINDSIKSI